MQLKRVVITGRGAVSPFGLGVSVLTDAIWQEKTAVRYMEDWEKITDLRSRLAAPTPPFDAKKLLPRTVRRTMGPTAIYATVAAREAASDAGLGEEVFHSGNLGVAIGSTTGSPSAYEDFYNTYLPLKEIGQIKAGEFFKMMGHSSAANVCLALGIEGQQWSPTSACTSSSQAIGLGYLLIQTGRQQFMLCGGSDEVHHSVTGVFDLIKAASCQNDSPAMSPRPFDKNRDGVVCGEGSGILLLEDYDSAIARGAHIYAEICGFGTCCDSSHIANPGTASMARAMRDSLAEAGVSAAEVDYVNAHATGTEQGDIAEALAIKTAIGDRVPVSSLKGHIGHTLGAAGSLETIITLEMMRRQELLPTRNLLEPDPACGGITLFTEITPAEVNTVVKNNFALGGVNTALVLRRIEG